MMLVFWIVVPIEKRQTVIYPDDAMVIFFSTLCILVGGGRRLACWKRMCAHTSRNRDDYWRAHATDRFFPNSFQPPPSPCTQLACSFQWFKHIIQCFWFKYQIPQQHSVYHHTSGLLYVNRTSHHRFMCFATIHGNFTSDLPVAHNNPYSS